MRTAYPPSTQAIKLTVRPATAKYADPATAAKPSSIAIVGTSAVTRMHRIRLDPPVIHWPLSQPPMAIVMAGT